MYSTISIHGVAYLYILSDLIINFNLRYSHLDIWVSYVIIIAYALLNFLATYFTGYPIYSILTWKDYTTAVWAIIILIMIAFGHFFIL